MKVFKFGGASVKDATGVRNLKKVVDTTGEKDLVVVVSAMGKMTNHLEKVVDAYLAKDKGLSLLISEFREYHQKILGELFPVTGHPVYAKVQKLDTKLVNFLETNRSSQHAFVYDQVVCYGELVSTLIISEFLQEEGTENTWLDVRSCIVTNANFRDAKVDWENTQKHITDSVSHTGITVTQGFLGSEEENNFTTTLGREGSDYTAAIFAYCLNAECVIIWKDVPGVLNADPRYFGNTKLLHNISYEEAIELAFYGASVIHPKTLQPLQRKEIPLFVKSFMNPGNAGTCVGKGVTLNPETSCFILKRDQVLISLSSLDFSFMMEDNISDVFRWLHEYKMKVELMQNSAISFSVCVDNRFNRLDALLAKLRERFSVRWNEGVTLYTIRHARPSEIDSLMENKEVLLKQESRDTVQVIVRE
ncbi:MAG: aspartate kinase [Bacteroidia bacterium]|nr:aspartate kinase [Bacteroidia bacterium]NNF30696.1 aspartate kinase [Flavobacteriaceae bacterium]MBT8277259.1 aspartate kinase [Bacteroidia bacterium]NNJ80784.1 aspartate kinase [Flavobacteriaceae bacterium]NNK54859.1 aspartate kinase [Flavobacteriaceae bacterium]